MNETDTITKLLNKNFLYSNYFSEEYVAKVIQKIYTYEKHDLQELAILFLLHSPKECISHVNKHEDTHVVLVNQCIVEANGNKIGAIKNYRQKTGKSLKETKNIIETVGRQMLDDFKTLNNI